MNNNQSQRQQADSEPVQSSLESQLADYLSQLSEVQTELLQVLAKKRECMAKGEFERLDEIQVRETDLGQRLKDCHDRRAELLAIADEEGLPSGTLGELAEVLPSDGKGRISNQVEQASQRIRLLQHQSLTNWVLAQRSLLHVSQMLEFIATGGRRKPTYGTGGTTHTRGSLMDQEA
jgi:flagellar biosynthesis/type III secretory pathway chaperone